MGRQKCSGWRQWLHNDVNTSFKCRFKKLRWQILRHVYWCQIWDIHLQVVGQGFQNLLKQHKLLIDCVPEVDGHRTWKNQDNTTLEAFSQLSKELCKLLWEKSHQQSCPSGNTESFSDNQFSKIRLVSAIVAGMLQG